jgi:hypothetical protein
MKKKPTPPTPDTSTPFVLPNYLKKLNSVPTNDKVGQTFVTSIKQALPKKKDS